MKAQAELLLFKRLRSRRHCQFSWKLGSIGKRAAGVLKISRDSARPADCLYEQIAYGEEGLVKSGEVVDFS